MLHVSKQKVHSVILPFAALAFGWAAFFGVRIETLPLGSGDAPIYQAMAEHPLHFTHAPHGYRILIPWLAHAVMVFTGTDVTVAFLIISSVLFAAVMTTILWWSARIERVDVPLAVQLSLLFACSYAGVYNVHNFAHVGFGEYLILVAGFAAIRAESFGALLLLVVLGGLIKESTAALLPVWFVYELGHTPWQKLWQRSLILGGAVLFIFAALRFGLFPDAMSAHAQVYTPAYIQELKSNWGSPYNVAMRISDAFGALWPLAAAGFICTDARARRLGLLIPLALAQILVATDISRMASTALPAILFFALEFLRRLPRPVQVALTALSIAVFLTFDHRCPATRWLLAGAYLASAATLAWIKLPQKGQVLENP